MKTFRVVCIHCGDVYDGTTFTRCTNPHHPDCDGHIGDIWSVKTDQALQGLTEQEIAEYFGGVVR